MRPPPILRRFLVATLVACSVLSGTVLASGAAVASPRAAPDQLVREVTQRIVTLADAGLPAAQREREIDRLLADSVAVERLARAVLGRHWRTADASQRERFSSLLAPYLRATYGNRLGEAAGYRLELGQPRPISAGDMMVPGKAARDDGAPIAVDWRVTQTPEGWRILDVLVEGVSMALTWRNEFDSVIGRAGMDGLLAEMSRRVEQRMAATS